MANLNLFISCHLDLTQGDFPASAFLPACFLPGLPSCLPILRIQA